MCVYTSIHLYLYTMSRPKTFAKMSRLGWAFLCWADLLHISTIHWYAVLSFAPWNLTWTRKNKQPLRSHSHFSASSWSYLRLKSPCPRRTVKTPQPHNLSVFSTNPCAGKKDKSYIRTGLDSCVLKSSTKKSDDSFLFTKTRIDSTALRSGRSLLKSRISFPQPRDHLSWLQPSGIHQHASQRSWSCPARRSSPS